MNRSTILFVIAVALGAYGVYAATFVPPMLVGAPVPGLLIGFTLQAVCALAAAVGVWLDRQWAVAALILLGVGVAGTWLFEGFVLGIVAYLPTILVAVVALAMTLTAAAYVNRLGARG